NNTVINNSAANNTTFLQNPNVTGISNQQCPVNSNSSLFTPVKGLNSPISSLFTQNTTVINNPAANNSTSPFNLNVTNILNQQCPVNSTSSLSTPVKGLNSTISSPFTQNNTVINNSAANNTTFLQNPNVTGISNQQCPVNSNSSLFTPVKGLNSPISSPFTQNNTVIKNPAANNSTSPFNLNVTNILNQQCPVNSTASLSTPVKSLNTPNIISPFTPQMNAGNQTKLPTHLQGNVSGKAPNNCSTPPLNNRATHFAKNSTQSQNNTSPLQRPSINDLLVPVKSEKNASTQGNQSNSTSSLVAHPQETVHFNNQSIPFQGTKEAGLTPNMAVTIGATLIAVIKGVSDLVSSAFTQQNENENSQKQDIDSDKSIQNNEKDNIIFCGNPDNDNPSLDNEDQIVNFDFLHSDNEREQAEKLKLKNAQKLAAEKITSDWKDIENTISNEMKEFNLFEEELNKANQIEEEKARAEKFATEKLAAEKLASEKIASDWKDIENTISNEMKAFNQFEEEINTANQIEEKKAQAEKFAAEKLEAEKLAADKIASDKAVIKKLAAKIEEERVRAKIQNDLALVKRKVSHAIHENQESKHPTLEPVTVQNILNQDHGIVEKPKFRNLSKKSKEIKIEETSAKDRLKETAKLKKEEKRTKDQLSIDAEKIKNENLRIKALNDSKTINYQIPDFDDPQLKVLELMLKKHEEEDNKKNDAAVKSVQLSKTQENIARWEEQVRQNQEISDANTKIENDLQDDPIEIKSQKSKRTIENGANEPINKNEKHETNAPIEKEDALKDSQELVENLTEEANYERFMNELACSINLNVQKTSKKQPQSNEVTPEVVVRYGESFLHAGQDTVETLKTMIIDKIKQSDISEKEKENLKTFVNEQTNGKEQIESKDHVEKEQNLGIKQKMNLDFATLKNDINGHFKGINVLLYNEHKERIQASRALISNFERTINTDLEKFIDALANRAPKLFDHSQTITVPIDDNYRFNQSSINQFEKSAIQDNSKKIDLYNSWVDVGFKDTIVEDEKKFNLQMLKQLIRANFNDERIKGLHSHSLWTTPWVSEPLKFDGCPDAFCRLSAAGPAYASSAPKNRSVEFATVTNFLKTEYTNFSATRSGTICEFDVKDVTERKAVARKLALQVLEWHANDYIDNNPDKIKKSGKIVIPFLWASLLTDSDAFSYFHKFAFESAKQNLGVTAADNETLLLEDTIDALKDLPVKIITIDGKEIEIEFDVRIWNSSCNQWTTTLGRVKSEGSVEKPINEKTESLFKQDVDKYESDINNQIQDKKFAQLDPQLIEKINILSTKKANARQNLLNKSNTYSITKLVSYVLFRNYEPDLKAEYENAGKELASLINDNSTQGELPKEYVELIAKREDALDLMFQIRQIRILGLVAGSEGLDHNYHVSSSLGMALASCLGYQIQFGCRSGKDRTAFADIEVKLRLQARKKLGWHVPFWLLERQDFIDNYREEFWKKSGNLDVVHAANQGGAIGANIINCMNIPYCTDNPKPEIRKAQVGMMKKMVGASKGLMIRPNVI
nr:hypothetical protein [Parachlamydiaceae bacterium]